MINPLKNPPSLNNVGTTSSVIGGLVYGEGEKTFDKNQAASFGGITLDAQGIVNAAENWSNTISNGLGFRSPMYIVGQVKADEVDPKIEETKNNEKSWKDWFAYPSAVQGAIRAVTNTTIVQEGVIIDGLGDVNGEFSMGITSSPAYYTSNSIVTNRYRQPTKLTMVVMVSDHYTDNVVGGLAAGTSEFTAGLLDNTVNQFANGGNTRSIAALYKLRGLMEGGRPFTVYTPHGIYENMIIKSIRPTTDENKMEMLYCTIDFQELLLWQEYASNISTQPTRKGITRVGVGWPESAAEKANTWVKGKLGLGK